MLGSDILSVSNPYFMSILNNDKNIPFVMEYHYSYLKEPTGTVNNDIKIDPKQMAHIEAIILSMTPAERRNPDIIKASRKTRIAKGCGLSVQEVNKLLTQFDQMKKMMKQFTNGKFKMPF